MKSKVYIWMFIFLLVAAFVLWLIMRKPSADTELWITDYIERGDIAVNVTATGSLSALTTVDVGTQVSGIISKLFADFNSEVKKGQVIALLDTSILEATYKEAKAMLMTSTIQFNELKNEYERKKILYDGNAISKSEYDLSLTNYLSAQSSVENAKAQLQRARINRQYAIIKAPIDGVVVSRNVDVGQTVVSALNSPVLFTIANDLRKMQLYANVDEADIGQVKPGMKVNFNVDAYPGENFTGEVKQIRLQPVVVQNVVTYVVVIDVPNPTLKLLPGLTANITFIVKERHDILKVKSSALLFTPNDNYFSQNTVSASLMEQIKKHQGKNKMSGDSAFVWVDRKNVLTPVLVGIGIMENGYAEISGKIQEGDQVVLHANTDGKQKNEKSPFMPSFRPTKKK